MATEVVYRVYAWDARRMLWTLRGSHDDPKAAYGQAVELQTKLKRRVIVKQHERKVQTVKPAIVSPTRDFRDQQAYQMSDLADAKKYYKSPG